MLTELLRRFGLHGVSKQDPTHAFQCAIATLLVVCVTALPSCSGLDASPTTTAGGALGGAAGNAAKGGTASAGFQNGGASGGSANGGTTNDGGHSSGGQQTLGGQQGLGGSGQGGSGQGGALTGGVGSGGSGQGGALTGGVGSGGKMANGGQMNSGGVAGATSASGAFHEVQSILEKKCGICHTLGGNQPDLSSSGDELYGTLTSFRVRQCGSNPMVTPSNAAQSTLVMVTTGKCGGLRMPQGCSGTSCVTSQEQQTISNWIAQGAKH